MGTLAQDAHGLAVALRGFETPVDARPRAPPRRAPSRRWILTTSAWMTLPSAPTSTRTRTTPLDAHAAGARRVARRTHVDQLRACAARAAVLDRCRARYRRRAPSGIGGPGTPGSSSSPISYFLTCVSGGTGSVVGVSTRIGTGRVWRGGCLTASVGGARPGEVAVPAAAVAAAAVPGSPGRSATPRRYQPPAVGCEQAPDAGGMQGGDDHQQPGCAPREAFIVNVAVDSHP